MDLKNRWVHFQIRDVYLPEPHNLLDALHGCDLLQGRVVETSDSGMQPGAFLVVEVEGIDQPVIVPVKRVLGAL
ncbi:MAG: hypothetical protein LAN84_08510 [Acidobacteriia bacterium]|nr:hypothetical protein [Terriglobia bacterium]